MLSLGASSLVYFSLWPEQLDSLDSRHFRVEMLILGASPNMFSLTPLLFPPSGGALAFLKNLVEDHTLHTLNFLY